MATLGLRDMRGFPHALMRKLVSYLLAASIESIDDTTVTITLNHSDSQWAAIVLLNGAIEEFDGCSHGVGYTYKDNVLDVAAFSSLNPDCGKMEKFVGRLAHWAAWQAVGISSNIREHVDPYDIQEVETGD